MMDPSAAVEAESQASWWVAWMESVCQSGEGSRAVSEGSAVLDALSALPESPSRRVLRVGLTLEIARAQWFDAAFPLTDAMDSVAACKGLVGLDATLGMRSRIATVLAGVANDLGELRWIEAGLGELTELIRALSAEQEPTAAARRMLDLAMLQLRVGDPVQGAYLVRESRAIFDARGVDAPEAQAVADHLVAMLPLHAPARAGKGTQALATARERCLAAEEYFSSEQAEREVCRVRETLGRLEALGGKREHAEKTLRSVIARQEPLGDLVGLSRSLAALSDLMADASRALEALNALGASIGCNRQKSSTLGVAYNRKAFETLMHRGLTGDVLARAHEVEQMLVAAEAVVGNAPVPAPL